MCDGSNPKSPHLHTFKHTCAKGQLISEWHFGFFKSPKKPTNFYQDFCPNVIGQKSWLNLVGFLGDLKTPKIHSEINWPLDLLGHFLKESKHGGKAKKSLDLVHEHLESDTPSSLSNCHQQSKQSAHCW